MQPVMGSRRSVPVRPALHAARAEKKRALHRRPDHRTPYTPLRLAPTFPVSCADGSFATIVRNLPAFYGLPLLSVSLPLRMTTTLANPLTDKRLGNAFRVVATVITAAIGRLSRRASNTGDDQTQPAQPARPDGRRVRQ